MLPLIGQYALRVMTILAQEESSGPLRGRDLSDATGVPPAYVSKVLRQLAQVGLLHSQRGHRGGFRLAKGPAEIRIADILAAVHAQPKGQTCAFGWQACDAANPCPLHPVWTELSSRVVGWADQTTLADILARAAAQKTPPAP